MVEVAARRRKDCEAIESELTQMHSLPLAERCNVVPADHAGVAPAKDELRFGERSSSANAEPLRARVEDHDVVDHVATS